MSCVEKSCSYPEADYNRRVILYLTDALSDLPFNRFLVLVWDTRRLDRSIKLSQIQLCCNLCHVYSPLVALVKHVVKSATMISMRVSDNYTVYLRRNKLKNLIVVLA